MATGTVITESALIKTGSGKVTGFAIQFYGVTAGDKVELIDSLTATGTARLTLVCPVAADHIEFPIGDDVHFTTGIYAKVTKTGGTLSANILFR
jgi:hypothetical protein